jgi:hypothetical protein
MTTMKIRVDRALTHEANSKDMSQSTTPTKSPKYLILTINQEKQSNNIVNQQLMALAKRQ